MKNLSTSSFVVVQLQWLTVHFETFSSLIILPDRQGVNASLPKFCFNLSADAASAMDPQLRLLLESVHEAFENGTKSHMSQAQDH